MARRTSEELAAIGATEELDLAPAYTATYARRYASIVPSIVAPDARAATLKLVPR